MNFLTSINDISKETLLKICHRALEIKIKGFAHTLKDKIIAILFFEPSTRTKMSFEAAIYRAGAQLLNFEAETSSLKKGESLEDTIKMASSYADVLIIRHPKEGTACHVKDISFCPVINAGDGQNEHPTQTILDLVTILENHGSLDNFTITLGGDLKYSRTIHSLLYGLAHFDVNIILSAPDCLALPVEFKNICKHQIILETHSLEEGLNTDFFYMTRVQKERIKDFSSINIEDNWILTKELCMKYAKKTTKIMHPLPRINELHTNIDNTNYQLYFTQAENGIYARIAILEYILGVL